MENYEELLRFYIVIAWHGTSERNAKKIIQSNNFLISEDEDEWLGKGIYFIESNKFWACRWAKKGKHKYNQSAAIKVLICARSDEVFDFQKDEWFRLFHKTKKELIEQGIINEKEKTDGHVIDFICRLYEKKDEKSIKIVRNFYGYTQENSNFLNVQVQICVKDPSVISEIKGYESC